MDGNSVSEKKQRLDHASLQRPQPSAATKADPCKRGDQGFQEPVEGPSHSGSGAYEES